MAFTAYLSAFESGLRTYLLELLTSWLTLCFWGHFHSYVSTGTIIISQANKKRETKVQKTNGHQPFI